MDALARLAANQDIKALKARYFRCMDTKDWSGLEAVFAPDLIADFRDSTGVRDESLLTHGAALYVANLAPILQDIVTVHHGHMPEIEITGDTTARGVWAMEDLLRWPEGGPIKTLHGFGHYHETYRKVDGAWRIQTSRLSRLRVDIT